MDVDLTTSDGQRWTLTGPPNPPPATEGTRPAGPDPSAGPAASPRPRPKNPPMLVTCADLAWIDEIDARSLELARQRGRLREA